MKHLIIFFYVVIFVVGFSTAGLFSFLYSRYKVKLLKYYAAFLFSTSVLVLSQICLFYVFVNMQGTSYVISFLKFVFLISATPTLYFFSMFAHSVLDIAFTRGKRVLAGTLGITISVLYLLHFSRGMSLVFAVAISILLILNLLFYLALVVKSLKGEKDQRALRVKKTFLTVCFIFVPLSPLDLPFEKFEILADYFPYGFLTFPLFYFTWNVLSVFFVLEYSAAKNKKVSILELNDVFIQKYAVTKREREIIALLIKGCSYDEIASQLTISMPTVKTHVSNIYKKIGIKNKIELFNCVQDCRQVSM